jgi:hypothetical protein
MWKTEVSLSWVVTLAALGVNIWVQPNVNLWKNVAVVQIVCWLYKQIATRWPKWFEHVQVAQYLFLSTLLVAEFPQFPFIGHLAKFRVLPWTFFPLVAIHYMLMSFNMPQDKRFSWGFVIAYLFLHFEPRIMSYVKSLLQVHLDDKASRLVYVDLTNSSFADWKRLQDLLSLIHSSKKITGITLHVDAQEELEKKEDNLDQYQFKNRAFRKELTQKLEAIKKIMEEGHEEEKQDISESPFDYDTSKNIDTKDITSH